MPMKNPPHPGELVRTEIIEALGLSVSKAAVILKVRRAPLSGLLRMQLAYDVAGARRHANDIGVERYVPA